jgi:hypothetical protein
MIWVRVGLLTACEGNFDPCTGVSCSGHGSCLDDEDTAVCVCYAGYHDEGLECVEDAGDGDADGDVDADTDVDGDADADADVDGEGNASTRRRTPTWSSSAQRPPARGRTSSGP